MQMGQGQKKSTHGCAMTAQVFSDKEEYKEGARGAGVWEASWRQ